eukprot:6508959-Pyramimonas_sp.AAC.1
MVAALGYGRGHAELSRRRRRRRLRRRRASGRCSRRLLHLTHALHRLLHHHIPHRAPLRGLLGQAEPVQAGLLTHLLPAKARQRRHAQGEGQAAERVEHVPVEPVEQLVPQVARQAAVRAVAGRGVGHAGDGQRGLVVGVNLLAHAHQQVGDGARRGADGRADGAELRGFVEEAHPAAHVGVLAERPALVKAVGGQVAEGALPGVLDGRAERAVGAQQPHHRR